MTKITHDFYQTKSKRTIKGLLPLIVLFLMGIQMSWGQQVIGQFSYMDGGFEGQIIGAVPSASSIAAGATSSIWTTSSSSVATLQNVVSRTGLKSANFNPTSTTKRLQSPTLPTPAQQAVPATPYTIQYYYRTAGATATATTMQVGLSASGTGDGSYSTAVAFSGTSGVWTKYSSSFTTKSGTTPSSPVGMIRSSVAIVTAIDVDDFVIYPGVLDETAPDAPTAPSIPSPLATQMNVAWTAAAIGAGNGVDGGGYMVVRGLADLTTAPNVNGIYKVGNTLAAGEQVVYIGTGNVIGTTASFNDTGLTPSTTYYYRIYSVDKAFNYSAPISVSGTTIAPSYAVEPTVQASNATFTGVTSTGFTVNFSAGDGTNNLVVIKSGSAVNSDPFDGSTYTASTAFGSGTQLGTGNYVVYNDIGKSVIVTGLTKATTYYVKVYSFNGTAGSENYLITSPASGNQLTLPGEITSTGLNSAGVTWATASAWIGGVVPGASDNVTIVAGDKIQLAASASCYNLTVQSTGKLYNNNLVNGGSMVYLTVFGSSATIDGTLGDKNDLGTSDCAFGVNFNGNLTINGSGTIRPARLRPNTGTQNATLTINADTQMTYYGSTGTGGAAIYTDVSGNDNITITVNAGKTLSFVPLSYLNTGSGSSNGNASTIINVNGTVTLPTNCNLTMPIASGKTCVVNVNGTLNVDKLNVTSAIGGVAPAITIGSTGVINISNTADFSSATLSAAVTGSGTFTLGSGATINIAAISGLEPVAGPIRTTTRNFSTGANYSYVGTAAQVPGSDLPSTVNNFTINNAAGVTLGAGLASNYVTITNGTLTVPSGKNLTVNNAVVNNGTLTIENNANLIQTSVTNTNSGTGSAIVKRNSNDLLRLDYTMWSSPVSGQNLLAFSPATTLERFYTYNPSTNIYNTIDASLNPFVPGNGYLIRMPNDANAGTPTAYAGVFTGTLNNGDVSLAVTSNTYNAIGNPYPSVVNANEFINGNTTDGTLYFWRKTNGAGGTAYASYNLVGAVVTADPGNGGLTPNGHIQVGQGFIVKATSTALNFTNAMRVTAPISTQFLKTKQEVQQDRIWLNMTTASGVFSQALVGYMTGATLGVDNGYDGKYINDSPVALTSNINGEEYTIQGRPAFDASDIVALNFKTDVAGDYTIGIDHVEGLFAAGQEIYLVDSKIGKETNLKANSYTFVAVVGTDNARFSLKFQKTLKVIAPVFNNESLTVYRNNGTLFVNSGSSSIQNIRVYDIQGRLIAEQKNVKSNTASFSNLKATHQALIVKVTSEDNVVVDKKVIN
jgi:hypothetical protein